MEVLCTAYMSNLCHEIVSFLNLAYQNRNELALAQVWAFHNDSFQA